MELKKLARDLAYRCMRHSGLLTVLRNRRVRKGDGWATVLVFHSVDPGAPEDGLNIHPDRFRNIVRMLARSYRILTLTDLVARLRAGPGFTGREVVVTFDDGYLNNYEHAFPILAEAGLPACFFLTVGYLGTNHRFHWDVDKGVTLPMMTWEQAREIADSGFEIGCHTWSHPDLGTEPLSSAGREIDRARGTLEDRLGVSVDHFAYPYGGRTNIRDEWLNRIREAGFASNSSAVDEYVTSASDPFLIPRLGASPQRSLDALRIDVDRAW